MSVRHLPREIKDLKNEWVAISSDWTRVAGHGETPEAALAQAAAADELYPTLIFIPETWPEVQIV